MEEKAELPSMLRIAIRLFIAMIQHQKDVDMLHTVLGSLESLMNEVCVIMVFNGRRRFCR